MNSTLGVGTVSSRSVRYRNRFARPLDRGTGAPTGGRQANFRLCHREEIAAGDGRGLIQSGLPAFRRRNVDEQLRRLVNAAHVLGDECDDRIRITPASKFRMLLHTNPTRERGECLGTRAGASEDM